MASGRKSKKQPPANGGGRKHAHLAPSASHRWIPCPGSVALCKTIEEEKTSEFAAHGTLFHRLVMLCLRHGFEPIDFAGQEMKADGFEFTVDDEMVDHLYEAIDLAWNINDPKKLDIEKRVSLERWIPHEIDPDTGGTLDIGYAGQDTITILDWKYGSGVAVSPFRNEQLMSYALAYWDQIARHVTFARRFRFIVFQPRIPGGGGEWEIDLDELLQFGKKLAAAARRTTEKNAPLVPGEKQCMWCPARSRCPAYDQFQLETMQMKFDDLDAGEEPPPLKTRMTPERRAYILRHRKLIENWLDDLHKSALDDALKGNDAGGFKAVPGRHPPSRWYNPEKAEQFLLKHLSRDEAFSYKLISPAQTKKKLRDGAVLQILDRYIDRGVPKPILVPEDYPRDSLESIADKFDDLTK
jgi:hypothetical protein